MKTFFARSPILAAFAVAVAIGSAPKVAIAGPGIDYWRNHHAARANAQTVAADTPKSQPCTDSRVVAVTETENALPNGRGLNREVIVGETRVCDSCSTPSYVMKPSWPNSRGPLERVAVSSLHHCTSGCLTTGAK